MVKPLAALRQVHRRHCNRKHLAPLLASGSLRDVSSESISYAVSQAVMTPVQHWATQPFFAWCAIVILPESGALLYAPRCNGSWGQESSHVMIMPSSISLRRYSFYDSSRKFRQQQHGWTTKVRILTKGPRCRELVTTIEDQTPRVSYLAM